MTLLLAIPLSLTDPPAIRKPITMNYTPAVAMPTPHATPPCHADRMARRGDFLK